MGDYLWAKRSREEEIEDEPAPKRKCPSVTEVHRRYLRQDSKRSVATASAPMMVHAFGRFKITGLDLYRVNTNRDRTMRDVTASNVEMATSNVFRFKTEKVLFKFIDDTGREGAHFVRLVCANDIFRDAYVGEQKATEALETFLQSRRKYVHYWERRYRETPTEREVWCSYFEFFPENKTNINAVITLLKRTDFSTRFSEMIQVPGMPVEYMERMYKKYPGFRLTTHPEADNMLKPFAEQERPGFSHGMHELYTNVPTEVTNCPEQSQRIGPYVSQGLQQIVDSKEYKQLPPEGPVEVRLAPYQNQDWELRSGKSGELVRSYRTFTKYIVNRFDGLQSQMEQLQDSDREKTELLQKLQDSDREKTELLHKFEHNQQKMLQIMQQTHGDILMTPTEGPLCIEYKDETGPIELRTDFALGKQNGYSGVYYQGKLWVPARMEMISKQHKNVATFRSFVHRQRLPVLTRQTVQKHSDWKQLLRVLKLPEQTRSLYQIIPTL